MRAHVLPLVAAMIALSSASGANADCEKVPSRVKAYLTAKPGWKIVHLTDLVADDQAIWSNYRPGLCPGLASADLQGNGRMSYGLSLVYADKVQTVILYDDGHVLQEKKLYPGTGLAREVVHTAPPGPTNEVETHRRIDLAHESLVFEMLEAGAEQYYWHDGQTRSVVISE